MSSALNLNKSKAATHLHLPQPRTRKHLQASIRPPRGTVRPNTVRHSDAAAAQLLDKAQPGTNVVTVTEPTAQHVSVWRQGSRLLASAVRHLSEEIRIRRAVRSGQSLDDRTLQDIGLSRHSIEFSVRDQHPALAQR